MRQTIWPVVIGASARAWHGQASAGRVSAPSLTLAPPYGQYLYVPRMTTRPSISQLVPNHNPRPARTCESASSTSMLRCLPNARNRRDIVRVWDDWGRRSTALDRSPVVVVSCERAGRRQRRAAREFGCAGRDRIAPPCRFSCATLLRPLVPLLELSARAPTKAVARRAQQGLGRSRRRAMCGLAHGRGCGACEKIA